MLSRLTGGLLLVVLFGTIFTVHAIQHGILGTVFIWVIAAAISGIGILGIILLTR